MIIDITPNLIAVYCHVMPKGIFIDESENFTPCLKYSDGKKFGIIPLEEGKKYEYLCFAHSLRKGKYKSRFSYAERLAIWGKIEYNNTDYYALIRIKPN